MLTSNTAMILMVNSIMNDTRVTHHGTLDLQNLVFSIIQRFRSTKVGKDNGLPIKHFGISSHHST